MNTTAFDGIVRELGAVSTRRSFARLLGGAVALGAGSAVGGDSLAKGKGHDNARGETRGNGKAAAEGKKGKKVTICYQNQTRTVKKKGFKTKFPGATLGPCSTEPQVCSSWIISGGPNPTTRIEVDDDLWIYHRAALGKQTLLIQDNNGQASSLAAVSFEAQVGEEIAILGKDVNAACRSLSPLWLHCATTGQKRMFYSGNTDGCAPGRQPSYFVSQNFVISL